MHLKACRTLLEQLGSQVASELGRERELPAWAEDLKREQRCLFAHRETVDAVNLKEI